MRPYSGPVSARNSRRPASVSSDLTCSARWLVSPYLQVDARERGRELPQIGGGCPDERGELGEAPMGRRQWFGPAREDQRQPLAIVPARLDPHRFALDDPGDRAL